MAFHNVALPENLSYKTSSGPGFRTTVLSVDSGYESRIPKWSVEKRRYDLAYSIRTIQDVVQMQQFYSARKGVANSWKLKDPLFYATAVKVDGTSNVAFDDEEIGTGDGSQTQFQLKVTFSSGAQSVTRNITLPKGSTVKIGVNGVEQNPANYSVNETTGIVTLNTAPPIGHVVTWGGEFYIPVRFGMELDSVFSAVIENFNVSSIPSIPVTEVFDDTSADEDFLFGGAKSVDPMSADVTLSLTEARTYVFKNVGSGRRINLQSATSLPAGGIHHVLVHDDASGNTISIRDAGVEIYVMQPTDVLLAFISVDSGGTKKWGIK